jgi:hypothetical protein
LLSGKEKVAMVFLDETTKEDPLQISKRSSMTEIGETAGSSYFWKEVKLLQMILSGSE